MSTSSIAPGRSDSILKEGNVEVSPGAIVIGDQTYIAKNITSVRAEYGAKPGCLVVSGAVVCAVLAFFCFKSGHWGWGLLFAAACPTAFIRSPSKLFITTAAGERPALTHFDPAFVRRVHDAVILVSSR